MKATRHLIGLCTLVTATALADNNTLRQEPVNLRADRIEINQKSGVSQYVGKVVFTQGTLRMTADKATVERQGELLRRVNTEGRPATFRDKLRNQTQFVEGEALHMLYEVPERQVHLSGNVILRRGGELLKAGEVHYNLNTESASARSQNGRRVTATLNAVRNPDPAGVAP